MHPRILPTTQANLLHECSNVAHMCHRMQMWRQLCMCQAVLLYAYCKGSGHTSKHAPSSEVYTSKHPCGQQQARAYTTASKAVHNASQQQQRQADVETRSCCLLVNLHFAVSACASTKHSLASLMLYRST